MHISILQGVQIEKLGLLPKIFEILEISYT